MSAEDSRISIYELKGPEEDRDPRLQRSDEQIERLKTRFDENGWLSPIVFTSDELLIVDGNTRINALKEFDNEGE
jgi:ParB-like chromosome segregation protein Spo0J